MLDYVVYGTVFPSLSKPGHTGSGTAALAGVVRSTTVPVLAIGGITGETARHVGAAGAAGVAAIGLFSGAPDTLAGEVARVSAAFTVDA